MRRFALFAVLSTTFIWAGATTVTVMGCSSSDDTKSTADAGKKLSSSSSSGDDDDTASGSSTSGSTSSGSTTSSGGTKDGGTDASTSSGGATALKIACAAKTCDAKEDESSRCCWEDALVSKATCTDAEGNCASQNSFEFACDDKADCKGADEKCCFGNGHSSCRADCQELVDEDNDAKGAQLCLTDAECGAGVKCAEKTCEFGNEADGKFPIKIKVCGSPKFPDPADGTMKEFCK